MYWKYAYNEFLDCGTGMIADTYYCVVEADDRESADRKAEERCVELSVDGWRCEDPEFLGNVDTLEVW